MFGNHGPGVTIDIPYDVNADGQRFLINEQLGTNDATPQSPSLTVVLNWTAGSSP